ncbi:Zinc dependent phospholipase C [Oceanobacillus limi]|uniref:Zinc dependent phospholipase C n=1 Tax=Oceanobacillus limi TaxID=930131 RepID=A0A1H9YJ89_9BACI|nr:zinc dependent phospholipase C family protein [Oceanobacillus limi]SES69145.1 Zinc dependent phospholipase C [Oceanobacillus limi]
MPNIWTHMLFCEDVVDSIGKPNPFPANEKFMNLGAQGPDPFFYHNFWPWIKEDAVQEVGLKLHQEQCGSFLLDLITAAKSLNDHVRAYVFGFVTHHILDRNTHPYIHYRAGYEGNKHQKLEVIIDTIMMEKDKNLKTWKVPVYKEINVGSSLHDDIVHLLDKTIKRHYNNVKLDETDINKAYQDMKLALKILADPYGWKNLLLKSMISSFSHRPLKDQEDYLNINKDTWYHPATKEPSTKSFIDLYEQGRIEAIEITSSILSYWNDDNVTENHLYDLIGDISYDTGKPLELHLENRYSDPIV